MDRIDPGFWRDRRVLLTGHTGFKGAWLTLWLTELGARVTGLSLPPRTRPSLFALAASGRAADIFGDVSEYAVVVRAVADCDPEIIIHMAAQALVRPSYIDPLGTLQSNVIGTANILHAARLASHLRAVVVVTSDKVYENDGAGRPFVESDPLGGHDPYSSSKACAEIVTRSFSRSFFGERVPIATARAGNVIGGGDWSPFRIFADIVAGYQSGQKVALRYPTAVRPWQHVLEPLAGYLMYAEALAKRGEAVPSALNFGPDPESFRTVSDLVDAVGASWSGKPGWVRDGDVHPHEAQSLVLSIDKARASLGWTPRMGFEEAVAWTADWYRGYWAGRDATELTLQQIVSYENRLASRTKCVAAH